MSYPYKNILYKKMFTTLNFPISAYDTQCHNPSSKLCMWHYNEQKGPYEWWPKPCKKLGK